MRWWFVNMWLNICMFVAERLMAVSSRVCPVVSHALADGRHNQCTLRQPADKSQRRGSLPPSLSRVVTWGDTPPYVSPSLHFPAASHLLHANFA